MGELTIVNRETADPLHDLCSENLWPLKSACGMFKRKYENFREETTLPVDSDKSIKHTQYDSLYHCCCLKSDMFRS